VGLVFLLPLLWFIRSRVISGPLAWRLAAIFALGALQGALGWYMVASGLVDNPRVSQFRLTAHLGLALLIIGAILWTAWGLWSPAADRRPVPALAKTTVAVVFVMALTGAMVAGTRAGFAYNTFPLMGETILPADLMRMTPWYLNFLYNLATIQFVHRAIAWTLVALVPALWWWIRRSVPAPRARLQSNLLMAALALQVTLGVATLLSVVAVPLAAAHQAGAVLLYAASLWTAYALTVDAGYSRLSSQANATQPGPAVPGSA
jgi:heme a synthase